LALELDADKEIFNPEASEVDEAHNDTGEMGLLSVQWPGSVEQFVVHYEPAAERDAYTVRLQTEEDWASAVEMRLHAPQQSVLVGLGSATGSATSQDAIAMEEPECGTTGESFAVPQVLLLRFGSAPHGKDSWERFIERIMRSPQFKPCLEHLESAGLAAQTPNGVLMLVEPDQYRDTCRALVGKDLNPKFNLIIAQDLEYLLHELLQNTSFQLRPKIKQRDNDQQSLVDTVWTVEVERTFLCYAPLPKDAATVVQSTTEVVTQSEAHYGYPRGSNPRCSQRHNL